MAKMTLTNPVTFYVPFTRVDPAQRIVEGYCYVNARVAGDKWNLTRGALERATTKYMQMPAVRAMHQPIAAGLGLGVDWTERGAKIVVEVVDDQEWKKVDKGVYRGFSIGGRPLIVRGNDVEEFEWTETSLVDRPADPEAKFTVVRAEDADGEYEIEQTQPFEPGTAIKRADGVEATLVAYQPQAETPTIVVRLAGDGGFVEWPLEGVERVEVPEALEAPSEAAPEATPEAEVGRADDGMTSENVPERQNLEGKPRKVSVRRVSRFAHAVTGEDGATSDCLHMARAAAMECRDGGMARAETFANMYGEAVEMTPQTFAAQIPWLAAMDTYDDMAAAFRAFIDNLMSLGDNTLQHQSVDEFADYLHLIVGDSEESAERADALKNQLQRLHGAFTPVDNSEIERLQTAQADTLARVETLTTELTTERTAKEAAEAALATAEAEVTRLANIPTTQPAHSGLVRRNEAGIPVHEFAANQGNPLNESGEDPAVLRAAIAAKITQLQESMATEADASKRFDSGVEIQRLQIQMQQIF